MLDAIIGSRSKVRAKVVCWNTAPCLIASFRDSDPPLVWQMDLEKLTSYSLKLVEKEGEWDLGYTVPEGPFVAVAHFDVRPQAEAAYEAVQAALMGGACASTSSRASTGVRWFRGLVVCLLVAVMLLVLGNWAATGLSSFLSPASAPTNVTEHKEKTLDDAPPDAVVLKREPKIETGVPVNADDVLPKDVE